MFFAEPPRSQYDVHFRLFGFPVRVHPFFWVVAILLGVGVRPGRKVDLAELLIGVGVIFASILIHELGHALMQRRFGGRPWITLYAFGGLASCSDCDRSPRSQILISLAGPAAGFAFAVAAVVLLRLTGHVAGIAPGSGQHAPDGFYALPLFIATVFWEPLASRPANLLLGNLFWVNIGWGLVNLLPIYPLDGGQVSREVLTLSNPRRGIVLSLQVSMVAAAAMAVIGLVAWGSPLVALMFGSLAYSSYQALQAYRSSSW